MMLHANTGKEKKCHLGGMHRMHSFPSIYIIYILEYYRYIPVYMCEKKSCRVFKSKYIPEVAMKNHAAHGNPLPPRTRCLWRSPKGNRVEKGI